MKTCKRCNTPKELSEFSLDKSKKDGRRYTCKECQKVYSKKYHKDYYLKNKEKIDQKNRKWTENNLEYSLDYHRKQNKEYQKKNRAKINAQIRNRKATDPLFKLTFNIRVATSKALTRNGFTKKTRTYEILGCSFEEFKEHIEGMFEGWMTWDNYGLYNGKENYGWDIDHIIPVSSAFTEEEVLKLSHYSNLRPLCSFVNRYLKREKCCEV